MSTLQRCSNPCFLSSVAFRNSDGLTPETRVRLTALDVREKVSQTAAPLGQAIITMSSIQESQKLRIPLRYSRGQGFFGKHCFVSWCLASPLSFQIVCGNYGRVSNHDCMESRVGRESQHRVYTKSCCSIIESTSGKYFNKMLP